MKLADRVIDVLVDYSQGLITTQKLTAAGALIIAFALLSVVSDLVTYVYVHFLRPGKSLKHAYGEWAVVTGATDGIGKAMAFEFARKGLNVVLISRTKSKLDDCATEIKAKYKNIEVRALDIDFSNFNESERKRVAAIVADINVGVLVNNVGQSYPYPMYFHELPDSSVEQLMSVNTHSMTWMTRVVLPKMVERKKGAVVNIASAAGVANSPLLSEYGASKSYVAMFTRAMHYEYESKGISFQCQVPMYVTTKLAKLKRTTIWTCSEKAYAVAAVKAIGYEALISPYWSHAIQIWFSQVLPDWIIAKYVILPMHLSIRKAGLKKAAEKKA